MNTSPPPPGLAEKLAAASLLRETGQIGPAIAAYREALALEPRLPDSWYNLGWLLRRSGDSAGALAAYDEALRYGVQGAEEVHLNRGVIFSEDMNDPQGAISAYEAALRVNPKFVGALFNLANTYEDLGQREQALAHYQQALIIAPAESEPLARIANLLTPRTASDDIVVRVEAERSRPDLSPLHRASLEFALGKLLDQVGEYDRAFEAYKTANILSNAGRPRGYPKYDAAAHDAFVNKIIEATPVVARSVLAPSDIKPVFILGQFRSGSTLLEQILSAHSQIKTGGELPFLHHMATQSLLPYPQALSALTYASTGDYRAAYLRQLRQRLPDATGLVTDKRPDNFYHIGLILRLFPEARILHTVRDARDVCLSTWFTHLDHSQLHAVSLEDIAHQYRAYQRLMQHWKSIAPNQILDVSYEALVASPEVEIRRALEFLGLPFEPGCLEFYRSEAPVRTASVWQVREPLYQRATGRWRNYEKHLGPLMRALGSA